MSTVWYTYSHGKWQLYLLLPDWLRFYIKKQQALTGRSG